MAVKLSSGPLEEEAPLADPVRLALVGCGRGGLARDGGGRDGGGRMPA
jgi:hypothetical protein